MNMHNTNETFSINAVKGYVISKPLGIFIKTRVRFLTSWRKHQNNVKLLARVKIKTNMEELSKFVIESFKCSKIEAFSQSQINDSNDLSNKILMKYQSTSDDSDKNEDNESIDIDITDLSGSDESKSSAEIPVDDLKRTALWKSEKKERDMRIFCVNINKTSVENINSNNNFGLKTKNWLLTKSFKENKPQKSSQVTAFDYSKGKEYSNQLKHIEANNVELRSNERKCSSIKNTFGQNDNIIDNAINDRRNFLKGTLIGV
ncbi:hypothetical protein CVS40_6574 [Lucilia cuprina]|nr:hypothetical protein CVS40_6574 [Lucilia cuprina]